jgi:hypothetical protein
MHQIGINVTENMKQIKQSQTAATINQQQFTAATNNGNKNCAATSRSNNTQQRSYETTNNRIAQLQQTPPDRYGAS